EQLTTASSSDSQPAWDSTGQRLAFTRNTLGSSDVWMFDGQSRRYSWLGSAAGPAVSPDGTSVAAVLQGHHGTRLVRLDDGNPVPVYLTPSALLQGRLSWAASAVITGAQVSTLDSPDPSPLYRERLTPSASPHGEPYDLVRLNDLQTGTPWLADTVDDSYRALRQHVRREVGYDFLGEVSEALRPINFFSQTSQYSSWYKSGRAVDTLFDLPGRRMEIVRQNIGGETYWRIMLRCTDQSGRCGRPITVNAWDYSGRARTVIAPEQGGIEKPNLNGYYIDFTTLAEMYGWERISSWDDDDFSWTWHFKAFEYWHYQKKLKDHNGVSNWYQAMLQVYPKSEVDSYFTWDKMRAAGEDPYLVVLKGVPIPPAAERWWQQLVAGRNGTY
ncbi:MAG: TolB family protein, partial [Anaerolineae bacterium]